MKNSISLNVLSMDIHCYITFFYKADYYLGKVVKVYPGFINKSETEIETKIER